MIRSWDELTSKAKALKEELGNPEAIWYRGQRSEDYKVLPSLLRFRNGFDKEKEIFLKFQQLSYKVFPRGLSDWETLFNMQHYGLPTRLLDWTDNLGVAVYFAVNNFQHIKNRNPVVYLLNPERLNIEYGGKNCIPYIPEDKDFDYKQIYWEKTPFRANYPIAIEPIFLNDRILAQKGKFTIHGDDKRDLYQLCPNAVERIIISRECVSEMQEFLESVNINERTIFPDIKGVAEYIKKYSGLE